MPTDVTSRSSVQLSSDWENTLAKELISLENIHGQNPDTGVKDDDASYLKYYTMRLFGSPFQLIDSVDRRFSSINPNIGNQYLRNFTLCAPILHVKPGMPIYTGGEDSTFWNTVSDTFVLNRNGKSIAGSLIDSIMKNVVMSKGGRLQKRMYGFRETYYTYMSHVNYMCRSMATFLKLTNTGTDNSGNVKEYNTSANGRYPTGIRIGKKFQTFKYFDWGNYRFLSNSKYLKPTDYSEGVLKSIPVVSTIMNGIEDIRNGISNTGMTIDSIGQTIVDQLYGESDDDFLTALSSRISGQGSTEVDESSISDASKADASLLAVITDKVQSVMFMVEPTPFRESYRNDTSPSFIESTLDGIQQGAGREIAFITQSQTDLGLVDNIASVLGDTVETASEYLSKLVEPLAGGWLSNLFSGAIKSIKGQKMIYPDIYEKSTSEMNYDFSINLSTPYGDDYNYFMEIIVPLCHLICLVAPRMISANSIASPFLVQAWIPGQATCQLGIISNMEVVKNPNSNRVSVHGYPLDIKVNFTVKELYNAMSISPFNDPSSFLYNETLNDYMANLAGLSPSQHTYDIQRVNAFEALEQYFETGEYFNDFLNTQMEKIEDFWSPYVSSGS